MLQNNKKLKSLIVSLWDTFWGNGLSNPITAIEQLSYLLFIKKLDELEVINQKNKQYNLLFAGEYIPFYDQKKFESSEDLSTEDKNKLENELKKVSSPKPANELRWSSFTKIASPEEMLKHVRNNVFPFVKNLHSSSTPYSLSMADAIFAIPKASLLKQAIDKIEEIYIEIESDAKLGGYAFQDIQGDVYEMLLGELSQAGKNGQFRTPRHIINLMVELVNPKLTDRIADPACGTSGFLLGSYQYILTEIAREASHSSLQKDDDGFERGVNSTLLDSKQSKQLEENLCGFDVDSSMVRLGLMNLMMHGIESPQIKYQDTLSSTYIQKKGFDVVLANPPFTGKLDLETVDSDLGLNTRSTELLFLSRISKMLVPEGRGAVIIPEGVLFGSSKAHKATREIILRDCCLEAVISLPIGVFRPYTGVKTSILIFTKKKQNSKIWNTKQVWFHELSSDGYSLDDSRRKLKINPLPEVKKQYQERSKTEYKDRKNNFFVTINEIQNNGLDLSYNRYKEYVYVEQSYEPPKEILDKLLKLENDILSNMNELNGLIG